MLANFRHIADITEAGLLILLLFSTATVVRLLYIF